MITLQSIHTEKNGETITEPLKFVYNKDEYTKLSTTIDGKEAFLVLLGEKNLIPELCEKKLETRIEEKIGVKSEVYKVDLDINSKNILVLRRRSSKIFDDSALIIKYRVPEENLRIKLIKKFTNTTSIRYIKISKDKKECLIFVTFRTLMMLKGKDCEKTTQFVNSPLDGALSIILEDVNDGKCYSENVSPLLHFKKALNLVGNEIIPINTGSMSLEFNNVICTEKGFDLLKGYNSIKDELYQIINPYEKIKFEKHKITEIYGIHLSTETMIRMCKFLTKIKYKYRFFNIPENDTIQLILSNNTQECSCIEDGSMRPFIKDGKQTVKLITPSSLKDNIQPYRITPCDIEYINNKIVDTKKVNNKKTFKPRKKRYVKK